MGHLPVVIVIKIIIIIIVIKEYYYFMFFKYYILIVMAMGNYNLNFILDLFQFEVERFKANKKLDYLNKYSISSITIIIHMD